MDPGFSDTLYWSLASHETMQTQQLALKSALTVQVIFLSTQTQRVSLSQGFLTLSVPQKPQIL